jgi:NAD(P)-dependent dehydrogenase (short-subunit alcohol dehydrogenase family)
VVTGGSAGIGRAVVRELAGRGYDVAVLARGTAGVEAAAHEVAVAGRRGLGITVDVADHAAVDEAADRVEQELGPITAWVNVAFVGALSWFWETSPEEYRRMTDVTYHGQVNGTRAALRLMRPRDRGAIVNVSSAMAHRSIPLQSAYCGAKAAVRGFTESVITELKATRSKVTVGTVTLPGVNTTQFGWNMNKMPEHPQPVPPIVEPEVAARAIADAVEHPRREKWVGIATVYTVLGNRIAPRFVDWYLARTGVKAQQTAEDLPRYGSNIFEPRDEEEDRGARGSFSGEASEHDPVAFVSRHRRALTAAGGVALGLLGTAVLRGSAA